MKFRAQTASRRQIELNHRAASCRRLRAFRSTRVRIVLAAQPQAMQTTIGSLERRIVARHRSNPDSKRLHGIPGVGVIGATAIVATVEGLDLRQCE